MTEITKTTFQIRRGYEEVWNKNNPILACGEPGFATDKNRLKIGDGVSHWRDLSYLNGVVKELVFCADTYLDFPNIGEKDIIYKAQKEQKLYQWNPQENIYEVLNKVEFNSQEIEYINGGNASAQSGTKVILKSDTQAAWSNNSKQILAKGELAVEFTPSDQGPCKVKIKIGDGVNSWEALPYFGEEKENIKEEEILQRITNLEEKICTEEEIEGKINQAIARSDHLKRKIITSQELENFIQDPTTAKNNVVYMLKSNSLVKDSYDEYMRFDSSLGISSFELIGETSVNLEDYVKKQDLLQEFQKFLEERRSEFQGEKGEKPIKGQDYYTEQDKAEIVQSVISALYDLGIISKPTS